MSDYNAGSTPLRDSDVRDREVDRPQKRRSLIAYFKSIWPELRKVVWPSRKETINYSLVVLFTLVLMLTIILVLDDAFSRGAVFLFK